MTRRRTLVDRVGVGTGAVGDGGIFGHWIADDAGLPAFEYTLDQRADPRAEWDTRFHGRSRLHWHQLGNDRIVAIATNDGWVQLYSHEHGPRWVNCHDEQSEGFAGGISYLLDRESGVVSSTSFRDLDAGAAVRRVFGCGYLRIVVRFDDLEVDRVVFAPFGDGRLLVSRVGIRNLGRRPRSVRHGECWDVNFHNIDFNVASWEFVPTDQRRARAAHVYSGYGAGWDAELGGLRARHPRGPLSHEVPHILGPTPRSTPDVVCVPLGTPVDGWVASRHQLFGRGGRARPDGLLDPVRQEHPLGGPGQGVAFLATTDLELAPGQQRVLGFAYGATPPTEAADEIGRLGTDPQAALDATLAAWVHTLPRVDFGREPWLSRELAWGAYYLRSGSTYHQGFRAHTLSQGGAYQYLAGFNAGPRATLQHALPLIWLAPDLAAEAARFTMAETTPEGEIAYSEAGSGLLEPCGFFPSDNDLWLLWFVAEYVLATRDRAFLRQPASYWPAPYTRPEPVWDHCQRALDHLLQVVGIGAHGLIKMRTGDWNDTLVAEGGVSIDRIWSEAESTLNTAMAVHVLRRFAELARYCGVSEVARRADGRAADFADAVRRCWRSDHLNRGWLSSAAEVGHLDLYLEPQPWALIAGVLDSEQAGRLAWTIRDRCADPYATKIFAAGGEGRVPSAGGGSWLAVNSTLAWGLGGVSPEDGWKELIDNTLHHHAEIYPEVWSGIWSGPDTYFSQAGLRDVLAHLRNVYGSLGLDTSQFDGDLAGQTWSMPGVMSMQAWPVQILFAHSEPLNASLWLIGVQATAAGLRIDPLLPFEGWSWDGGLLGLAYHSHEVRGTLGSLAADVVELDITLPSGLRGQPVGVAVNGEPARARQDAGRVRFRLPVAPGDRSQFVVREASGSRSGCHPPTGGEPAGRALPS